MLRFSFSENISTKSKTYQKEGWFILEEENQIFGKGAEAVGNNINLESEDKFSIYHKDNEDVENNVVSSAKDLTDFFDALLQDEPEPSEEEVNKGIAKILEKTHPEEIKSESAKPNKNKKAIFRVLFIAALLSAAFFSCLCVVGSSHNISIENGFATFAKDTVKIVFFGEEKEEYIDVKTLIENLNSNGYEDVLLPQKLYKFKSSIPVYSEDSYKVKFYLNNDTALYSFVIEKSNSDVLPGRYFTNLDNAKTIVIDDVTVYVFEFETGAACACYVIDGYRYFIQSEVTLSELINTAQTIIKAEE